MHFSEADTSSSTVASTDDGVQKYNAQNEVTIPFNNNYLIILECSLNNGFLQELILLVDKLKAQVAEEREKNLNLERDVRESVTETFSKIITDMEKSWK